LRSSDAARAWSKVRAARQASVQAGAQGEPREQSTGNGTAGISSLGNSVLDNSSSIAPSAAASSASASIACGVARFRSIRL